VLTLNKLKKETKQHFKIAHIITGLNTGGAEMVLIRLLSTMDRDRFLYVVISLLEGEILRERIINQYSLQKIAHQYQTLYREI